MIDKKTRRLVMKSNIQFMNGKLTFPKTNGIHKGISSIRPTVAEDGGFVFYLQGSDDIKVCHIGIRTHRKPLELSFGVEEAYRKSGYMQEALTFVISWIFEKSDIETLWALVADNPISEHILIKAGFEKAGSYGCNGGIWFSLHKNERNNLIGADHE